MLLLTYLWNAILKIHHAFTDAGWKAWFRCAISLVLSGRLLLCTLRCSTLWACLTITNRALHCEYWSHTSCSCCLCSYWVVIEVSQYCQKEAVYYCQKGGLNAWEVIINDRNAFQSNHERKKLNAFDRSSAMCVTMSGESSTWLRMNALQQPQCHVMHDNVSKARLSWKPHSLLSHSFMYSHSWHHFCSMLFNGMQSENLLTILKHGCFCLLMMCC